MHVLITGSHGFCGQNLLEHPGMAKHKIFACKRSKDAIVSAVCHFVPDMVIHLAGHVGGIQANLADPARFLADNLAIGMNVVETARRYNVPRLLNIGSSCMYPVNAPQPFIEESLLSGPVEPSNEAYALAKLSIMKLCEYVSRQEGFAYKTLIPPGLYGRHAHFEGDQAHLVCAVMDRLHKAKVAGAESASVWGDGNARREFLFAGDLADCIVEAIDRFDTLPPVMNVGTGTDLSVDQWTRAIADVVGFQGWFTHDPAKPSGQAKKVMDVSRATQWGWQAKTSVSDGLRFTYDWFRENNHA